MNTDLKPTIPEDQQTLTQPAKKTRGKQKIPIEFISNKSRRSITFYKRKSGLIKKAQELNELTKCQVLLLMASETDHIYSYASDNLQPIITNPECQEFIRSCIDDCPNDNLDDVDHSEDEFLGDTPSKYISCLDLKDMTLPNFFGTKSKPELTPKHSNDSLRSISSVGIKSSNDSIISRSSMDSLVSRNSLDSLSTANDLLNLSISTPHFAAGKMDDIEHTLGEEKRKNPFKMPLSKSNHNSLVKPPLMELAPFKPKLGHSSQIGLPVSSLINPNLSESKDIVTIKSNNSPRRSTQFINQNQ